MQEYTTNGIKVIYGLVQEEPTVPGDKLEGSAGLARAFRALQAQCTAPTDRECVAVFGLDAKNRVTSARVVSIGTLTSSVVHPREVFRAAILENNASVALAHNHPSGDPEPSRADIDLTERILEAGSLLGIPLVDHVIVGEGRHYSFRADHPELWN